MVGAAHNIKPYSIGERPAGSINVTDPYSRNLKTPRGWVQGYNAQAIVTAAESARASRTGVPRWQPAEMRNASRRRDPTYTSSMATNARTVRLTPASYDLLEQEARRRGTDPDALADELLRSDLGGGASEDLDAALARSDELRSRLPEIDGVALAREARRELDNRDA